VKEASLHTSVDTRPAAVIWLSQNLSIVILLIIAAAAVVAALVVLRMRRRKKAAPQQPPPPPATSENASPGPHQVVPPQ